MISPPTGCFETLQRDLGFHVFVGRGFVIMGQGCLVSCKEFHKVNYSLSCTMFAHLARSSSVEKKPFVLSEPKTILRKHKVVRFFAKFSYIYIHCILQECNCPAHWKTNVHCFVPNLTKSYSPLLKATLRTALLVHLKHQNNTPESRCILAVTFITDTAYQ